MHFYALNTVVGFGQHEGQSLAHVLDQNPNYLNFCVQMLDHFAVRRADVEAWQQHYPHLAEKMTAAAWATLDEKEAELNRRAREWEREDDDYDDDTYSARDAERDTFDALTDGQYGDYDDWGGDMDGLRDAMGY